MGVVLAGLFLAGRPWLPRIFTDSPVVLERVDALLPFVIWMQPLNALVFVWDGVLMGAEDFRFLASQMLVSAAGAVALLLLVAPLGWGLPGAIVALMAGRLLTLATRYWGRLGVGIPETLAR